VRIWREWRRGAAEWRRRDRPPGFCKMCAERALCARQAPEVRDLAPAVVAASGARRSRALNSALGMGILQK